MSPFPILIIWASSQRQMERQVLLRLILCFYHYLGLSSLTVPFFSPNLLFIAIDYLFIQFCTIKMWTIFRYQIFGLNYHGQFGTPFLNCNVKLDEVMSLLRYITRYTIFHKLQGSDDIFQQPAGKILDSTWTPHISISTTSGWGSCGFISKPSLPMSTLRCFF